MRRVILLVLLALALPLAAAASSIDISSLGGTITDSSTTGLSLSGATMNVYAGISGNLGTVAFTTGPFATGGVGGGTFGVGGTFTITGNGSVTGVPNGVIFSGTFTSGSWTFHPDTGAYVFVGDVKSTSGRSFGTISEVTLLSWVTFRRFAPPHLLSRTLLSAYPVDSQVPSALKQVRSGRRLRLLR